MQVNKAHDEVDNLQHEVLCSIYRSELLAVKLKTEYKKLVKEYLKDPKISVGWEQL